MRSGQRGKNLSLRRHNSGYNLRRSHHTRYPLSELISVRPPTAYFVDNAKAIG
jgi:hypothetical protein